MDIKRYVTVPAIKTNDNQLIPVWDDSIVFEKERYGNVIHLKDEYHTYHTLVECIYDLKTKEISAGIELDSYPDENDLDYTIGQSVYYEVKKQQLAEAIIAEIVYEEYDLQIYKGRKLDKWMIKRFKDVKIDNDALYAIKIWKPYYVLDNGKKIKWEHELHKKFIK